MRRVLAVFAAARAVRRRADCTPATCIGGDDAAYDRDLFKDARVVRRFAPTDPSRYMSVVDFGDGPRGDQPSRCKLFVRSVKHA